MGKPDLPQFIFNQLIQSQFARDIVERFVIDGVEYLIDSLGQIRINDFNQNVLHGPTDFTSFEYSSPAFKAGFLPFEAHSESPFFLTGKESDVQLSQTDSNYSDHFDQSHRALNLFHEAGASIVNITYRVSQKQRYRSGSKTKTRQKRKRGKPVKNIQTM
jgi:hypothetical protein